MSQDAAPSAAERVSFGAACDALERALRGPARRATVDHALAAGGSARALGGLRSQLRAHDFRASGGPDLSKLVRALDVRGRKDGFHVLLEWEQAAGRFSREEIPVLMLDHFAGREGTADPGPKQLAILLDFYFLYLLGLALMRAWDDGDPGRNLDRITALLIDLQGGDGSGHRFADHAGSLLFVATSNFQPDDRAYHRLLEKVWRLDPVHRVMLASIGAPVIGTHLRWAFSAIYERDLQHMRQDNFVDYPWLFFSVATLMDEYARLHEAGAGPADRRAVVGALLNGLTPDPWAFVGKAPGSLAGYPAEHARFQELFARHRDDLLDEIGAHLPSKDAYSPISLHFNFPHNALVATVTLALTGANETNLPLDALLTPTEPGQTRGDALILLARAITGYAAANPERRGDRRVLPVAYNEAFGLRSFSQAMSALKKGAPA